MRFIFILPFTGLLFSQMFSAPRTERPFFLNGTNSTQYLMFDKDGHALDVHDSFNIRLYNGEYFLNGEAFNPGSKWNIDPQVVWGGFSIYKSTDLKHWGPAVTGSSTPGYTLSDTAGYAGLIAGCTGCNLYENPILFYDTAASGIYQNWGPDIQTSSNPATTSFGTPGSAWSVLPCSGDSTQSNTDAGYGGGAPYQADDGNVYLITGNFSGNSDQFNLKIQRIVYTSGNSGSGACTNSKYLRTGSYLKLGKFLKDNSVLPADGGGDPRSGGGNGILGEGGVMFERTDDSSVKHFYLLYHYPGCTFCNGVGSTMRYIMTNGITDPTDSTTGSTGWINNGASSERMLSTSGCAGQLAGVARFGGDRGTYLLTIDRWKQIDSFVWPTDDSIMFKNQGGANLHFETLSFTSDGTIQSLTCSPKITNPLVITSSSQNAISNLDQTSGVNEFIPGCDIGLTIGANPRQRVQTFTAGKTGNVTISFTTWQSSSASRDGTVLPNANLTLQLMSTSGGVPLSNLGSAGTITRRVAASDGWATPVSGGDKVGWSPRKFSYATGVSVTAGTTYGIRVSSASNTGAGCYGFAYNDTGIAYSPGKVFITDNGGASWAEDLVGGLSKRALKFETIVP